MKKILEFRWLVVMLGLAILLLPAACKQKSGEVFKADPAFAAYISAFSSGTLSCSSTIKIRLTGSSQAFAGENKAAIENLFSFSPSLKGETVWLDAQTLEFRPKTLMESGKIYKADFALSRVMDVENRFRTFSFGFRVMPQNFEIGQGNLLIEDEKHPEIYTYEAKLLSADFLPSEKIPEIVKIKLNGEKKEAEWVSENHNRVHSLKIRNIKRSNATGKLILEWDGDAIKLDSEGKTEVEIPSLNEFNKTSHFNSKEELGKSIFVYFSDLLDPKQDLSGLITNNQQWNVLPSISKNCLKLYFGESAKGTGEIQIHQALINFKGKRLAGQVVFNIDFEDMKPALRQAGNGTILPSSQGLVYPFEALGLKAVKLTIIKIYESNVAQFFQTNRIDGNYEMNRVGRPVLKRTIPLTNSGIVDFMKWNRFTLDLNEYLKADPGAIYQIKLSFTPDMLVQPCDAMEKKDEALSGWETDDNDPDSEPGFDQPGYYYYDYYGSYDEEYFGEEEYDWRQRENPCNPSYYSSDKMISRNLFASDLGIIAKRGNSGDIFIAVSNIVSAKPMRWVKVDILDMQLQSIAHTETDGDGFAHLKLKRTPFLLVASHGRQKGYLRLDDASSLSLSNFPTSGVEIQKGLKGFLYGERGVWRPGDTLFLAFILEDKLKSLPTGHPLVFELRNPKGQIAHRNVRSYDKTGIFSFICPTQADAPTGKWTASVKVGGATFTKQLRIESIKPNRLKINFEPLANTDFGESGNVRANLNVKWMHGTPAKNLKAEFDISFTKARAEFKGYQNYYFDDIGIYAPEGYYPVYSDKLNEQGNAQINTNLGLSGPYPSAMNASYRGKVFEPGGDFSVDFQSFPLLPFDSYIGMKLPEPTRSYWLEVDTRHEIKIASVNQNGKPVDVSNIRLEIYRMEWSWWWQKDEEGAASYVNSTYRQPVFSETTSTKGGKASVFFKINYPDWGRYYVRMINPNGQSCGKIIYLDWPMSRGRSGADMPGGATMLALALDKDTCQVGKKAKLTIPGFPGARALISLENGSTVLKAWWEDANAKENVIDIPVDESMTPNIFIHVSLIQPHVHSNDFPMRQYGLVLLKVENPETRLHPVIKMAAELKPEQNCSIRLSEKSGKAMTYTIAVVDEGLLDLTHFKTPDPHSEFYATEALGIKSFDLYDDIIGAYGGKLERLLSVGGDEALKPKDDGKNVRFKPVVKFLGPFNLAKGKTASHSFKMPNYIGSVRTMVIAAKDGAYGMAENTTPVKQDLMIMATLPRVLGPNEEVLLPVNVFALSNKIKNVSLNLKISGPLSISGESSKTVSFTKVDDKMVYFRLKAKNTIGIAKVEVTGTGNGEKSSTLIEIPIRNANIAQIQSLNSTIVPGKKWNQSFSSFGMLGTNSAMLELSSLPPLNLDQRLNYLITYPHGCLEQTTSGAFPQLYLSNLLSLSNDQTLRAEMNIKAAISRLMQFQLVNGGFVYWPGNEQADNWCTSFAGHFLIEARRAGYSVPEQMLASWRNYQAEAARNWEKGNYYATDDLTQAYRLYLLALNGTAELGAMNRLNADTKLSTQAAWRLAGAYLLTGYRDVAKNLIAKQPTEVKDYREMSWSYGSAMRDEAMILEITSELGMNEVSARLARTISADLNTDYWYSTQETAYSLIALARYYKSQKTGKGIDAKVKINGSSSEVKSVQGIVNLPLKINEGSQNTLEISNNSKGTLFVRLNKRGIPAEGKEEKRASNLNMDVSFTSRSGESLDISKLKQGTEIRIEVTVRHPGIIEPYQELALTQIFPSGWEIYNKRMESENQDDGGSLFNYQDIRDDRVLTYFNLERHETKRFVMFATATYAGKFYFPGFNCAAMYDNSVSASEKGFWIEVVK